MKALRFGLAALLLASGTLANASELQFVVALPDCQTSTIRLTTEVIAIDTADEYRVDYYLQDEYGSTAEGSFTFNGPLTLDPYGVTRQQFVEIVPIGALSGFVSGTAYLTQLTGASWLVNKLWDDDPIQADLEPELGYPYPDVLSTGFTVECASRIGTASIGDFVWQDDDRDGIQDDGEPGIQGCSVELWREDGIYVATVTTDSSGFYLFDNLHAGSYAVRFDTSRTTKGSCLPGSVFSPSGMGIDHGADSDADEAGLTEDITLGEGEHNLSIDAGLYVPTVVSLGDRVWEDLNADGVQNCEDDNNDRILGNAGDTGPECGTGIDGVIVELYEAMEDIERPGEFLCTGMIVASQETMDGGFYLFDDLLPGDYCVRFDLDSLPADFCGELDAPMFTLQGQGTWEGGDSDAGEGGYTPAVTLRAGDLDRSVDAGVLCPAMLGDRVWRDMNEDGIQDIGEPGIGGVTVRLFSCDAENPSDPTELSSTETDRDGFYEFIGLAPGEYCVQFIDPFGNGFTRVNVGDPTDGGDSAQDSDCGTGGMSHRIELDSRESDLGIDCGLVAPPPPQCALTLDRTCRVEPLPPEPMEGSCKGKLQQFTIRWTRDEPITVSGVANDAPGGMVSKGDVVTFFGPFDNNDVFVDIAGSPLGSQSVFHMSCSDDDFDGPEDCGKLAGDGKGNESSMINAWTLEGFVDAENRGMSCSPQGSEGAFDQSCTFEPTAAATCDTAGKPRTVMFEYTGGGCAESNNGQSADKAICIEPVDADGNPIEVSGVVMIEASGDENFEKDNYLVTPSEVGPGDTFEVSYYGDDLDSNSYFRLTDSRGIVETISAHMSCSQPLAAGDVYGSLTLRAINGMDSGVDVTYHYALENSGDAMLSNVSIMDRDLGMIMEGMTMEPGDTYETEMTTRITGTTTSMAEATGTMAMNLLGDTEVCVASDMVTTEAVIPPCAVSVALYKVEDDKLKLKVTNADTRNRLVTLDTLYVEYPAERGYLEKVKLDGDIYKEDDSDAGPLYGPVLISSDDWTKEDIEKRQLEPGETRTLEIETKEKSDKEGRFEVILTFAEGCTIHVIVENKQIIPNP